MYDHLFHLAPLPTGVSLLRTLLGCQAHSNKGFYDFCMHQIGGMKLSADHTFKVMAKCWVLNADGKHVQPYQALYLVLNELGMVVAWRFCVDKSIPVELLQELKTRHNIKPEEIYTDQCCLEKKIWTGLFPDAKILLDLFHAVQRVVREISKKKQGSKVAAKAFGACFRGEGDKTVTRSEKSRTATFDTETPDNVVTRMRHWKRVFAHLVNQEVRKEIAKLEDKHSECLYPQHYAGTQINECLHRLLNAVTRFRSASPHYVEGLLTYILHLYNARKFTATWKKTCSGKGGMTKGQLTAIAPHFAACCEANCDIPTTWKEAQTLKATHPSVSQLFGDSCKVRFGLDVAAEEDDDDVAASDLTSEHLDGTDLEDMGTRSNIWEWFDNMEVAETPGGVPPSNPLSLPPAPPCSIWSSVCQPLAALPVAPPPTYLQTWKKPRMQKQLRAGRSSGTR